MHRTAKRTLQTLCALGVIALCGFTTPINMLHTRPVTQMDTRWNPAQVKDCILRSSGSAYQSAPFNAGWTVWEPEVNGAFAVWEIKIDPTPIGAHVTLYTDNSITSAFRSGAGTYAQYAKPCIMQAMITDAPAVQ
jgi:hypothetical protein